MKTYTLKGLRRGNALLMVLILMGVGMVMVGGLVRYSNTNASLNKRSNDYQVTVAAAEAATEKVLSQITWDYQLFGDGYVQQHLDDYRQMVPLSSESGVWGNFNFLDNSGTAGRVNIQYSSLPGFTAMGGQYGPLKALRDQLRIEANASLRNSTENVVGAVYQDVEFDRIPIFQYAIFYNVLLEFTPQPPMNVIGPVHCNTNIYMNPDGPLTFYNDVTSSGTIIPGPNPTGPLPALRGSTTYLAKHDSGVSTLNLPIGTNNSPTAVQQVLDPPPLGEDPLSSLGRQRYYNKADLIFVVRNTNVVAASGRWNNFAITVGTNQYWSFLSTNKSFYNKREAKTVRAIQFDIGNLRLWNATNTILRPYLPYTDVRTIYVADQRTFSASDESGVRLVNGGILPPQGLTVATPSPLYIQGNYNAAGAALGSTNTSSTRPASVAADAVTILSTAWNDGNSSKSLSYRVAGDTTVNAAILTGIVPTTGASDSGGVENFPRFLEEWTGVTFTYNGSLVCMFNSRTATGQWKGIGSTYDIYNPPNRNWGWDQNFQYSDKLPPATPSLTVLVRSNWRMPAAFTTNVVAGL